MHALADQALARVRDAPKKQKKPRPVPAAAGKGPVRYPVRAFVLTWAELHQWWMHYDLDELAGQLTEEQADAFYTTAEGTHGFATQLRAARDETPAERHLRAL